MNKILDFVRTTIVGGVLYLIPLIVLAAVLGKALQIAHKVVPVFAEPLNALKLGDALSPQLFAVLLVVVFCFLAGLFSRTKLARSLVGFVDSKILINIPGYGLFRSMAGGSAGIESHADHPVLVSLDDDAWQIAFIVDTINENEVAVYVPGAPETRSGSLYFLPPDRLRRIHTTSAVAFQTLRRMGVGSADLLKKAAQK